MADFNFDLAGVCERVLRQAKDLTGPENYAMNLGRSVGALDYILSPANGKLKSTVSKNGKIIRAKVLYKQRTLPSEVLTGELAKAAGVCDTAEEPVEKDVDVEITDRVFIGPRKFSNSNLVQICQDTESWVKEFLMSDLRAMREQLSIKVLSVLGDAIGINVRQNGDVTPADDYTTVQLLATTGSQKVPLTGNYNDILMDYQNMQFSGVPVLIGQGNLQTYYALAGIACCNSTTPYADALSRSGAAFYLDQAANAVLGNNKAIMTVFGASHLLWFNENDNININSPTAAHIVVPDPVYPMLKWDFDFKWDECEKQWIYAYSAYFDTFNVFQADSFKQNENSPGDDDELLGVTGIWGYNITAA